MSTEDDNSPPLEPYNDPAVEARLVALVLGEASDFERAELEQLLAGDPALRDLRERLERTHKLLAASESMELSRAPAGGWRLPDGRRAAVLDRFREQPEPAAAGGDAPAESVRRWAFGTWAGAAAAMLLGAFLLVFTRPPIMMKSDRAGYAAMPEAEPLYEEWQTRGEGKEQSEAPGAPALAGKIANSAGTIVESQKDRYWFAQPTEERPSLNVEAPRTAGAFPVTPANPDDESFARPGDRGGAPASRRARRFEMLSIMADSKAAEKAPTSAPALSALASSDPDPSSPTEDAIIAEIETGRPGAVTSAAPAKAEATRETLPPHFGPVNTAADSDAGGIGGGGFGGRVASGGRSNELDKEARSLLGAVREESEEARSADLGLEVGGTTGGKAELSLAAASEWDWSYETEPAPDIATGTISPDQPPVGKNKSVFFRSDGDGLVVDEQRPSGAFGYRPKPDATIVAGDANMIANGAVESLWVEPQQPGGGAGATDGFATGLGEVDDDPFGADGQGQAPPGGEANAPARYARQPGAGGELPPERLLKQLRRDTTREQAPNDTLEVPEASEAIVATAAPAEVAADNYAIAGIELRDRVDGLAEAEGETASRLAVLDKMQEQQQQLEAIVDFSGTTTGEELDLASPERFREEAAKGYLTELGAGSAEQEARGGGEERELLERVVEEEFDSGIIDAKKDLAKLADSEFYDAAPEADAAEGVEVAREWEKRVAPTELGDIAAADDQLTSLWSDGAVPESKTRGLSAIEDARGTGSEQGLERRRSLLSRFDDESLELAGEESVSEDYFGSVAFAEPGDDSKWGLQGSRQQDGEGGADYLAAYMLVDEAWQLEEQGKTEEALTKYNTAADQLAGIRQNHPDRRNETLSYRSKHVADAISRLSSEAEKKPVANTATATGGANMKRAAKPEAPADAPAPPLGPERLQQAQAALDLEVATAEEPVSTFSLNVSDVSFKLAQAALIDNGSWPEADKIRPEEFVNAFDYGDPAPAAGEPVAHASEQCVHPFLPGRNLLRVSMQTAATGRSASTPLRLTVLLDKSGSMERADREASVAKAMEALAGQLRDGDEITLIGFARTPRLIADRLPGAEADQLAKLVAEAPSEGGTNLEEALRLAAEAAGRMFLEGAENRIVLLTDGAANLGELLPDSLQQQVVELREQGIALDACGVGFEGLDDEKLEALTRKGDGRYYVLDRPEDADAGFVRQLAGALRPAARNVKVQVEFNPGRVTSYRLSGFEKHRLEKEDFRNDKVDAAELAAAESGNAIYQIEVDPAGQGPVGKVSVRFRDVASGEMVERSWPIPYLPSAPALADAGTSMKTAALASVFAEKLKGGPLGELVSLDDLAPVGTSLRGANEKTDTLIEMIEKARSLSQ